MYMYIYIYSNSKKVKICTLPNHYHVINLLIIYSQPSAINNCKNHHIE